MKTYVYIDASNLFYGGRKSLGWSIDQKKLFEYLRMKYKASRIFYFAGVEIRQFPFDYLKNETVPIQEVEKYLFSLIEEKGSSLSEAEIIILRRDYNRARFYLKLEHFGYHLILKPVKTYNDADGNPIRKANCDVDMTLMLIVGKEYFDRVIILSGDGDFLPVLKHLKENGKEVLVLARGSRTAREIKKFAGNKFTDFEYLREKLKRISIDSSGM